MSAHMHATAQRSRAVLPIDPLDIKPVAGFRVAFTDGLNVWHLTPSPDGRLMIATEHNGLPVSLITVDEPFEALDREAALGLSLLWRRVVDRAREAQR